MEPVTSGRPLVGHRVGDEERQKTAEILSDHHAHGRLSQEEFEDRLGMALTAQTSGELGRLLADLPLRLEVEPAPRQVPTDGWLIRLIRNRFARGTAAVTGAFGGVTVLAAAAANSPEYGNETFFNALFAGLFGLSYGVVSGWRLRRGRSANAGKEDSGAGH